MKRRKFIKTTGAAGVGLAFMPAFAQDTTTAVSQVGDDLDLYAVLDLLEESENLEEFEKALNDEKREINNLDLNEDGEVDYIKVEEHVEENIQSSKLGRFSTETLEQFNDIYRKHNFFTFTAFCTAMLCICPDK